MELIKITPENLMDEHICCAISNNKDCQVVSKKSWLSERLEEGLVFLKADARGKCFIEYIPSELAWVPIEAAGYMYINCLWVSGKLKGNGYSDRLLEACIQDSHDKGKKGLAILSSEKKMGFLSDKKYLLHKGFRLADQKEPYFELMYLPFEENAEVPKFRHYSLMVPKKNGFVLYYTRQCPFTAKYVPIIEQYAKEKQLAFESILIDSREAARKAPVPFSTYALFYNGEFVTHEILSVKKFEALVKKIDK